jgi:hypothetical protein
VLDPYDYDHGYQDRVRMVELIEQQHPFPAGLEDQRQGILILLQWEGLQAWDDDLEQQGEWNGARTRGQLEAVTLDGERRLAGGWAGVDTIVVDMFTTLQARGEFPCYTVVQRPSDVYVHLTQTSANAFIGYIDEVDAASARGEATDDDAFRLQRMFYDFYTPALSAARVAFQQPIADLGAGEGRFINSFSQVARLLGAINYPLTETFMAPVARALPLRPLRPSDYDLLRATDLPLRTRAFVYVADVLANVFDPLDQFLRTWFDESKAPALARAMLDLISFDPSDPSAIPGQLHQFFSDLNAATCDQTDLGARAACLADLAQIAARAFL